jgi:23S rRNA (cytidine1920-2'-O)/16S rRNA (cytidine1409-2'-O)-methyltransferase
MPKRTRLDRLLVERGLAPSRERARALILAGRVFVDEQLASKAGTEVSPDARVALSTPDHPYVGRGGVKLAHALDVFGIDFSRPTGRHALDVGASTGGFTDVLLRRAVADVIALDVGHGQLAWSLRTNPRVLVRERVNARALTAHDVPHAVDLVCVDVSFISVRLILPALRPFLIHGADLIVLVKPQFEAGRDEVGKGGIVTDPAVHEAVVARVIGSAQALGFSCLGQTPSPIAGASGNREFFVHLRFDDRPVDPAQEPEATSR